MNTKTAIVTGAGSGIGLAVTKAFLRDGANVVLNGRTEEKLARAAAELGGADCAAIVNIGTILSENGVHGLPSSAPIAAKGGITALVKNLSVELASENIRINAVAPGVVPTPLYGELNDQQLESLHRRQPLGRYGMPRDIADAVLYLANAEWITGVILPVAGGVDASGDGAYHGANAAAATGAA